MVNTAIRLIIFFVAKDGEAVYSQQKQDQELTVAQIMNSLFPIQTYIEESLHPWNKPNLILVYELFDVLLNSVS